MKTTDSSVGVCGQTPPNTQTLMPPPDVIWRQAQSDLGVNVTLSDRNEPPVLNTSFSVADQTIEVGTSTTLSFSGAATDPEGDAIFYAAASGNTTTATVSFSANTLTINALAVGTSTITWTFQSANSPVSMGGTFNVTVEAALRVNTTVQFDEATLTYRLPSLAAGPTALTPNTTARAGSGITSDSRRNHLLAIWQRCCALHNR